MDPSVQPTQTDQPINRVQPPVTQARQAGVADPQVSDVQQPKIPTPTTGSMGKESAPAIIVQETGQDADEEEIQVASQESKTQVIQQASGSEGEMVEVQTVNIEPKIDAAAEHVMEKSPDQEKPELSETVKQAGVTHSGPGIIPDKIIVKKIPDNKFGITALAVPYDQAALEEKKTPFKSSKHWLMGMYEFVWRKINPNLGRKK